MSVLLIVTSMTCHVVISLFVIMIRLFQVAFVDN